MLIEKIKKGLDSTYYLLGVVIAMIIFWAIPYTLLEINILKYQETVKLFENIALILIGVFILLTLSFYENIFYIVPKMCIRDRGHGGQLSGFLHRGPGGA